MSSALGRSNERLGTRKEGGHDCGMEEAVIGWNLRRSRCQRGLCLLLSHAYVLEVRLVMYVNTEVFVVSRIGKTQLGAAPQGACITGVEEGIGT